MAVHIGNDWDDLLRDEWGKAYYQELRKLLINEYQNYNVFPPARQIFRALELVSYADCKVVIIGQDPYHGDGQANGLAFSVNQGVAIPPSLVNIYKEMKEDLRITPPGHGDLTQWASQGVLLLNSTLTVRAHEANSHAGLGWQTLTNKIIALLGDREEPLVFVLWGNFAQSHAKFITNPNHLVLMSAHPSPLSAYRGFFGSKPFSKINRYLTRNNMTSINWQLS